jgi:hypothetical protein
VGLHEYNEWLDTAALGNVYPEHTPKACAASRGTGEIHPTNRFYPFD